MCVISRPELWSSILKHDDYRHSLERYLWCMLRLSPEQPEYGAYFPALEKKYHDDREQVISAGIAPEAIPEPDYLWLATTYRLATGECPESDYPHYRCPGASLCRAYPPTHFIIRAKPSPQTDCPLLNTALTEEELEELNKYR